MKQFLLNLYAKIRDKKNPIILPKSPLWDKWKVLPMYAFSRMINSFPYKSDPFGGLNDYTGTFEHFIDPTIKSGRDCDDYARMWTLWGIYNGYTAYEIIVTSKRFFKDAHYVTMLYKDSEFTLCNYRPYRQTAGHMGWLLRTALEEWDPHYKKGFIYSIVNKTGPLEHV